MRREAPGRAEARRRLKPALLKLLGKEAEAVVVSVLSGEASLAAQMAAEIRELAPDRRHFTVGYADADLIVRRGAEYGDLRRFLRRYRIGIAPVLFDGDASFRALRRAMFLVAPGRILAYNARLQRHHLRLRTALASALFLRGVPVDRIYIRPWRRRTDEGVAPEIHRGREFAAGRKRVLVASPYVPYPLAHGGAVRMYHLLREAAREFDIVLFAFRERKQPELAPLLEFCSAIVLVNKRGDEQPRWSTIAPPETYEYTSPELLAAYQRVCNEFQPDLRQIEYSVLAAYPGDVLVEHDVTFDLYRQIVARERTAAARWNWWRWLRFERQAFRRFRRVAVMSEDDAALVAPARAAVIPNGVDLERFRPEPERPGERLLFVGSFRHFPNIQAFRFFTEKVWPLVTERFPGATLTVVAGADPLLYWRAATGTLAPREDRRVRVLDLVADVRPHYVEANVVIVPTPVSAGTCLKVLEAMAMRRAVVATACGCAGLGVEHRESVWIADGAAEFAAGIARLLEDAELRARMAAEGERIAEERFGWERIGEMQRELYRGLVARGPRIRAARAEDIGELDRIQRLAPEAVLWDAHTYLGYDCRVAEVDGRVTGFIVTRRVTDSEAEVLSLIVDPAWRRRGLGARLLDEAMRGSTGAWYLEVRESNRAARKLYRKYGFEDVSLRPKYYQDNGETAVVMRRQSC